MSGGNGNGHGAGNGRHGRAEPACGAYRKPEARFDYTELRARPAIREMVE